VRKFEGRPVAFFAVAAGDTLAEARKYVGETRMAMPVFADALSLMETRYGQQISLNNIHQTRVIDPTGKIVEYRFEEPAIEKALKDATWKYKDASTDKKLDPAVLLLEWGRYAEGLQKLKPFLKRKDTAESAQKVYDLVKEEVQGWVKEADECKSSDPVKAYDLYAKAAAAFNRTEEPGTAAAAGVKALGEDKAVKAELAARKAFAKVNVAASKATPQQKAEVAKFCHDVVKKYPGTPTAEKAKSLAQELGQPVP
jgi:hypothetical protein